LRQKDYIIIWAEYLDSTKSRSEGRRVPLSLAVKNPSPKEIAEALQILGLEYDIEEDKKYPRAWWSSRGRVKVKKNSLKKNALLKQLCKIIRDIRAKKKYRSW